MQNYEIGCNKITYIHSLILLHFLDLNQPKLLAHLPELNTPEWPREDVGELTIRIDVLNRNLSYLNTLPNEIIASIDVLTLIMKDRILSQRYR